MIRGGRHAVGYCWRSGGLAPCQDSLLGEFAPRDLLGGLFVGQPFPPVLGDPGDVSVLDQLRQPFLLAFGGGSVRRQSGSGREALDGLAGLLLLDRVPDHVLRHFAGQVRKSFALQSLAESAMDQVGKFALLCAAGGNRLISAQFRNDFGGFAFGQSLPLFRLETRIKTVLDSASDHFFLGVGGGFVRVFDCDGLHGAFLSLCYIWFRVRQKSKRTD